MAQDAGSKNSFNAENLKEKELDRLERRRKSSREWYHRNKEKCKEYKIKYIEENKEEIRKKARESAKQRRSENPEKYREYKREYYAKNKKKCRLAAKKYRENNRDKVLEYLKEYHKKNRDRESEYSRKRNKEYRENNPNARISGNLRASMRQALLNKSADKLGSFKEMTGCTPKELKTYLETLFSDGMSWDNYGVHGWHIDHIRPCASFDLTKKDQQKKCFNYKNLQPLWARENLKKGASLEWQE